jgi:hypothetical protein
METSQLIQKAIQHLSNQGANVMAMVGIPNKSWWIEDQGQWGSPVIPWGIYLSNQELLIFAAIHSDFKENTTAFN